LRRGVAERIVSEGVEAALGERLLSVRPMGGGCIGEVYRAELANGMAVVAKVDQEARANLEREGYMLRYLREKTDLPVPEVYHSSDRLLLMQLIPGSNGLSGAEAHAAELLAGLHSITAEAYGHERDTLIGSLSQPNPWTESWIEFFRDHRLLYAARIACEAGRLSVGLRERVEKLAERLGELLEEPERPSLIHGDAWSGNVLAEGDKITAFLDPAIYHADPEIELAYINLFNSFGEPFFGRYSELRPIKNGFFEERRYLYGLYPLLVHVYYFGGGYARRVEYALRRFGF
jgi:fructosamine-3-kinase